MLEKPAWGIPRTLMTMVGDYTMGILTRLGNKETLMISTGDQTKENLDLLENKEDFDGFRGELRMRIFNLRRIKNFDKFMLGSKEGYGTLLGK